MLQLPAYTRAVLIDGGIRPADIEARVSARLGRQGLLTRPGAPPFTALIDQSVLHREVGGPKTMAAQLRHLAAQGERPGITIQMIPFTKGAHPAVNGSYVVLEFEKEPTIVHLEHTNASLFLDDTDDTERFTAGVATLKEIAFAPDRSLEIITQVADQYEKRGVHDPVQPPVA